MLAAALLAACGSAPPPGQPVANATSARATAASTAHPLATQAALQMLAEGGSAA